MKVTRGAANSTSASNEFKYVKSIGDRDQRAELFLDTYKLVFCLFCCSENFEPDILRISEPVELFLNTTLGLLFLNSWEMVFCGINLSRLMLLVAKFAFIAGRKPLPSILTNP